MADNLTLHKVAAQRKIRLMRKIILTLPTSGRGIHLGTLMNHTLNKFEEALVEIQASLDADTKRKMSKKATARLTDVASHKFERLGPQLDLIHYLLATYRESVDRPDVPVGLQHLVDVLIKALRGDGDPMIRLDAVNMYSTVDLVDELADLKDYDGGLDVASSYAGDHPIAFNLPALDPDNALLAPILAHEVTHGSKATELLEMVIDKLEKDGDTEKFLGLLDSVEASGVDRDEALNSFYDWSGELICDAIAIVLTGPAFLFAYSAFLPPSGLPSVEATHPPHRDRISFHLEVLDRLGWTPVLEHRIPKLHQWYVAAAPNKFLAGSPIETFLRDSTALARKSIIDAATSGSPPPLDPAQTNALLDASIEDFQNGVPSVQVLGQTLTIWQVILSGWFAAFLDHGDRDETLVRAVDDPQFNALLVKALEMSGVVSAWRLHERPVV